MWSAKRSPRMERTEDDLQNVPKILAKSWLSPETKHSKHKRWHAFWKKQYLGGEEENNSSTSL